MTILWVSKCHFPGVMTEMRVEQRPEELVTTLAELSRMGPVQDGSLPSPKPRNASMFTEREGSITVIELWVFDRPADIFSTRAAEQWYLYTG